MNLSLRISLIQNPLLTKLVFCEEKNHHADIHFGWGYAVIELTTHDKKAITELDIELATLINAIGG